MQNEAVSLVTETLTADGDGFDSREETLTEVFAQVKSVRQSEFYEAARDGINVQAVAVVNEDDYQAAVLTDPDTGRKIKPSKVVYDGTSYKIVRAYRTDKKKTELTLQEVE